MRTLNGSIMAFLITMFLGQSSVQASEPRTTLQVKYVNHRLTVRVDQIALGELLERIRKETGIEFEVGQEQFNRRISLRLGPLPVEESLQRLLSRFNHVFLLNPDNKLVKVMILGSVEPGELGQSTPGARVGVTPTTKATAPEVLTGESVADPSPMKTRETMVIQLPSERMTRQPPAKTMVIQPPTETQMVIKPPAATMTIQTPNREGLPVKGNKENPSPKPSN